MERQRDALGTPCPLALGEPEQGRRQPRLDRIYRERRNRVVGGAQPPGDHERHLLDERGVALGECDHGVRRDLEDHGGLGGLGARRIGTLLDRRHTPEDLPRPQQFEDHVLPRPGMPHDLHVA